MDSILTSIKKQLGIAEEYIQFDPDLVIHINSVLGILTQLGVGPPEGYSIVDQNDLWEDFLPTSQQLEFVKSYVYLKVRMIFDPPASSVMAEAFKATISELEWRILTTVDTSNT